MARKKVTQGHVARLAKVSPATVSRVANASARVSPPIEARVRHAAAQLQIELKRKNKGKLIAFLLSNRSMLHPFHSRLLSGAESYCASGDYNMVFLSFRYPANVSWRELHLPSIFQRRDVVDGFILAGANSQNLIDLLSHKRVPFSVLGNNVVGDWQASAQDVVWFDDIRGSYEATRYLLSQGHRDIWFTGNCRLTWFARRYAGYCRAMEEAGAAPRLAELDCDDERELGYLATKSILTRGEPVSAICAGGDTAAHGVYKALMDCGLRVPEEMSVIGFNDTEAAILHPPLTTVAVFPEQVGRHLAEMLINRLAHPDLAPQHACIPTQLIKRESCHRLSLVPEEKARGAADTALREL
jgi:DNA-binding LacI/PurR family transcriptional regulator